MRVENIEVYGFRAALRCLRNPLESWDKSDTTAADEPPAEELPWDRYGIVCVERPRIGPLDMALALKLIRAGDSHRKFLRQIFVWWDVTLPRYVWQEVDTYKVATVRNSCSTMHKLGHRELTREDFQDGMVDPYVLNLLNAMGREYRAHKSVDLLRQMKATLPESYLQRAGYTFNYQTAIKMYFDRRDHRLPEWSGSEGICEWLLRLPYMRQFLEATGRLS